MSAARITVVVVTWQGRDLVRRCLDSLRGQTEPHRVVVVDNASTDGTAELLTARYPEADILRLQVNTGFAGGAQAGLDAVRTPYAALLNNDAAADPGWLAALTAALDADPRLAAATSRLLLADGGRVNNAGGGLTAAGYGYDIGLGEPDGPPYDRAGEVFGFSGGAAALRMDAVRAAGGFARRLFLYYEDTDLSWRLRLAGWSTGYVPTALVHHLHSASTDQSSAGFAFHNERNRLLVLTRCAPAGVAARQLARFPVTTASLALKRLLRRRLPAGHQFDTALRLRVFGSYLRLLPWAVRGRREVRRRSSVPRAAVTARWMHDAS